MIDRTTKILLTMITLLLLPLFVGLAPAQSNELEFFPAAGGRSPFSDAVRVGNLVFVSGKLGTGEGGLVPEGIAAETGQALENIKASLERYGSSMERVVKCTVFLADMAEFSQMNAVYVTFFGDDRPARSAVGVNGLALNARVEIECIGVISE